MEEQENAPAVEEPKRRKKGQVPVLDSDKHDSVGTPKDGAPIGPRGDAKLVHQPLDSKPRPAEKPVASTVTDKIDSAGNLKHPHEPHLGPRGPEAAKFVRDSFKVDKHR